MPLTANFEALMRGEIPDEDIRAAIDEINGHPLPNSAEVYELWGFMGMVLDHGNKRLQME